MEEYQLHLGIQPSPAKLSSVKCQTTCVPRNKKETYFCDLLCLGHIYSPAALQQKLTNVLSIYSCLNRTISVQDVKVRSKRNSFQSVHFQREIVKKGKLAAMTKTNVLGKERPQQKYC